MKGIGTAAAMCDAHGVHACACMHAGFKIKPHLLIPALMKKPQKTFEAKEDKRLVNVVVFMNRKAGMYVRMLTGSRMGQETWDACGMQKPATYVTKAGKPAARMTADEYVAVLKDAVVHYGKHQLAAENLLLIHDRSSCHPKGGPFALTVGKRSTTIKVMLAPPRSPDLMPLDYSVFGLVKRALRKELPIHTPWHATVLAFVEKLQTFEPTETINALPKRMRYVQEHGGEHYEERRKT